MNLSFQQIEENVYQINRIPESRYLGSISIDEEVNSIRLIIAVCIPIEIGVGFPIEQGIDSHVEVETKFPSGKSETICLKTPEFRGHSHCSIALEPPATDDFTEVIIHLRNKHEVFVDVYVQPR